MCAGVRPGVCVCVSACVLKGSRAEVTGNPLKSSPHSSIKQNTVGQGEKARVTLIQKILHPAELTSRLKTMFFSIFSSGLNCDPRLH